MRRRRGFPQCAYRPLAAQVEMEEPANEEPVLEQKNPELAAPNLAVPTAGQLETTTPAPDAPIEPPVMPPTKEQAAKRAAQLKRLAALPEHLVRLWA